MKPYLLVGLGNPTKKYKYTRHNIGSLIINYLIKKKKIKQNLKNKLGNIYIYKKKNKKFYILLSNSYINNIGLSIKYFLNKYKLTNNNLIVISDDIYLKFGKIKIKKNESSSGGHNGLKNIHKVLKKKKYIKIKIGIGHNFKYGRQNQYVLNNMEKHEINYIYNNIFRYIYDIIINL
ncbi:MAG: aminoacyl-tRNA hydrolase [Candidatus Shikimatogenerans sp. JK-2022]|nr:aminoacyl-tRNA hydrolase [Candidatus Shikimatogenerans bostrichidophilus]